MKPYWQDSQTELYVGDCREIIPAILDKGIQVDCIITDPPYAATSLPWDRWPGGWLEVAAAHTRSLWCFGSLRMYLTHGAEFGAAGWKFSQDIIWEKHNGSGFHADRFKRVHEQPTHWYRGDWGSVYRSVPVTADATARTVRRKQRPPHTGHIEAGSYTSEDGGPRLMRSVIAVRSMHGQAIHETEKPPGILEPMITYACPPGGLVVDMFAGSGSTLDVARCTGRRAIGIELREECAEAAAKRLSQQSLFGAAS